MAVSLQTTTPGLWNVPDHETGGLGAVVETAIQRSSLLYIRKGLANLSDISMHNFKAKNLIVLLEVHLISVVMHFIFHSGT